MLRGGKTVNARRTIKLNESTIGILKKHRLSIMQEKISKGKQYNDMGLVCCTEKGTQANPSNIRRLMKGLIDKAGIPFITFHQMRHTHATILIEKGVSPKAVSNRLGHSDVKVTLGIYSHVTSFMEDQINSHLEEILA